MKKEMLFTVLLCGLTISSKCQHFSSKHFTIQKLSDGVYAAIAKNGSYAICNAGIVDLGDATLIFDPFMSPEAAGDLKRAAKLLTGKPVKYIVNSHFHNDHIGGNQIFNHAAIISTERTRELIAKFQPQEIADDRKGAAIELKEIVKENTAGMSAHALDEHIMWKGYYEALVRVDDTLRVILPSVTFTTEMAIYGTKRNARLVSYGEGHTESDAFLYLPDEKIAFLGDLLFIQNQPWLGDGNPEHWATSLDSIARMNPSILVPGHGPVGALNSIDSMKIYFETVKQRAKSYQNKGISPEQDSTLKSPSPYDNWFLSGFFKPNVISEYKRLLKN